MSEYGPCVLIGIGGVGESGASEIMAHQVTGPNNKMVVLRTTGSSLCANTGAVAIMLVNGAIVTSDVITAPGSIVQTEAAPGDLVSVIVHSFPLLNGIMCVRLGELEISLQECELVRSQPENPCVLDLPCVATSNWYAWNNKMPPKPDDFHIVGDVEVPNPGVDVELIPATPQGFNPAILLMNLILTQRPGIWPALITTKQVRYDRVLVNSDYEEVNVLLSGKMIAKVAVDTVQ